VSDGEEVRPALEAAAGCAQRTTDCSELMSRWMNFRLRRLVEREIIGIAQGGAEQRRAPSGAQRITFSGRTVRSMGRLSVATTGRGIARRKASAAFGMTSMQERAERIGASLTIVTAPRAAGPKSCCLGAIEFPTQGARCRLKRSS
jgi:signal transduction histidine kinase